MIVYCTGTLTNKGNISMTARGAKATGQNVYLWRNEDESYEYVPATCAAGGVGVRASWTEPWLSGNNGESGKDRRYWRRRFWWC